MTQVLSYPLADGGVLAVEAASPDVPSGLELASAEDRLKKAEEKLKTTGQTLESAVNGVIPGLEAVTSQLRKLSPDEVAVEFGLTVTAESGIVVAKGSAEVHFTATLKWNGSRNTGSKDTGSKDSGAAA
jgi:hypothetical protein